MIEPLFFRKMAKYASISKDDTVLDIGAGLGFLTGFLAEECKEVIAVEADAKLAKVLRFDLARSQNVKILVGDILKLNIPPFEKIVSIPPYHISSQLLMWILSREFDCAVLILQKEFAERLVAKTGTKHYGTLAVLTYYHAKTLLLNAVPKESFYPQPKVDSVIVRLVPKKKPPFALKDGVIFKKILRSLFTRRNRKVRSAIIPFLREQFKGSKREAQTLAARLPFGDRRARELKPEDFGELSNAVLA